MAPGKKNSVLQQRMKRIRKEMNLLDDDIKSLSKSIDKGGRQVPPAKLKSEQYVAEQVAARQAKMQPEKKVREKPSSSSSAPHPKLSNPKPVELGEVDHGEDRLAEYLTGSFQSIGPLRRERRLQRNRAIAVVIFVLLLLYFVLRKFAG